MSKDVSVQDVDAGMPPGLAQRWAFDLEDFPDAAVVFDSDYVIVAANRAYCRLTDYPLEELIGLSVHSLAVEPQEEIDRRVERFEGDGRQAARGTIRTRSGEVRLVDYTARSQVASGRHIAFVRDVTDMREHEHELTLRAGVLDSLEAGVYVVGPGGKITLWNRAAEEITGYSAAEAIGARTEDLGFAPRSELDALSRRVLDAMQTDRAPGDGRARALEVVGLRRRKDGSIFPSRADVSPLRDERGAHVGILVMFHDLGRDRVEGRPPGSEVGDLLVAVGREAIAGAGPAELLDFALQALAACLNAELTASWRIDARSGVIELESDHDWPADGPRTLALDDPDSGLVLAEAPRAFADEDRPRRGGILDQVGIRSGIVAPLTGHGRSAGALGVYSRELRRFSPAEVEAVVAVSELVGAIRARVRLERIEGDLDIARRQASLGALISGVAHDFNNMLSVMLGYARLMEKDAQATEILAEGVAEIEVAARRAMGLSRSLIDLGRPLQTEPEVLEVTAVLREVGDLLHRTLGETVELKLETESPGLRVVMPPGELDRVVVNLVANARDALPDGGSVTIRAYTGEAEEQSQDAERRTVVIEVSDNGTGMPPEVLEHVLEPSFTTKERGQGSGIGLSAADTILRAAGGTIELESELNRGTTARVTLPFAPS